MSKQSEAENEQTSVRVEVKLLREVRKEFPEAQRMTYTGLVDFGLRRLLGMKRNTWGKKHE